MLKLNITLLGFLSDVLEVTEYSKDLVQLPQLKLLEDLGGGEDAGVDDAGHGEGPPDNGTDGGEEVIDGRSALVIPHCYRVQIISANSFVHISPHFYRVTQHWTISIILMYFHCILEGNSF